MNEPKASESYITNMTRFQFEALIHYSFISCAEKLIFDIDIDIYIYIN